MSRIVVAMDSFKGSLSAKRAVAIIADVLAKDLPDADIVQCPLADGGEGTAEILSPYLSDDVYLIESARLIGLNLPEMQSLDVVQRGSGALGQAILAGLDAGRREYVIGLGGSATNDCGLGMLMALGVKAFDAEGEAVQPNLAGLLTIESIDITGLDARLAESRLTVLSDVVSPLCGKNGATSVYGPQKGVREGDVERINAAMARFAELCGRPGLANEPGAGAAGGLGFAMRLMGGELVSGGDYVIEKVRLREQLQGAVWVITGEGRSDAQTLQGKLPLKVAQAARSAGAKVALISGAVDEAVRPELEKEFDLVIGVSPDAMAVEQALQCAEALLSRAVQGSADRFMLR